MQTAITSPDQLLGLWKLQRTEIVGYDNELESLEFGSDGTLEWCIQPASLPNASISKIQRHFEITETGFDHASNKGLARYACQAWLENGDLMLIPPHGHKSWFSRC